ADARGRKIHQVLRAADHNILISKLLNRQQAGEDEGFISPDALVRAFEAYPRLIANTENLLAACSFTFVFGRRLSRQTFTGEKYDDLLLLEKLAREGLAWRYGDHHPEAARRLARELEIIDQCDFNAYFLITWDFIQYGRSRGFFHVGRGSGANSLVAYCLGISDVDPLELDLYFERFLNPKRAAPPDFDIDYSWRDRDDVLDYVLKRYRNSHAVLLATYNTFQPRSAIREMGKVFGLPSAEIDRLSQQGIEASPPDQVSRQVLYFARLLQGLPDHLSIHAGGVLISEAPIHSYTATNLPPKGFPISHFDMHVAEEIGLHKFDILSQRGLGHIRDCVDIVQAQRETRIDIRAVATFKRDPKVQELLRTGETVGCFYIESPAMRGLLRKLQAGDYLTLVAASSVIRPGVARSGMMRAFIERHRGAPFAYAHPKLEALLDETYGVMVYQEDVLKVVHGFAGLDLAEADLLRRAMSGKDRAGGNFARVREQFLHACRAQGYPEADIQEIWRQIESFAGYSFSKAHSASYAVESLQSLYLKAHFPIPFMVAVINNFGGFYRTEFYVHEARRWGAQVHAPCVNHSTYLTRLEGGCDVYLGFIHLKELEERWGRAIAAEREAHGPFADLQDFCRRLPVGEANLRVLVRAGAFRFTGKSKASLLWEVRLQGRPGGDKRGETLFAPEPLAYDIPDLPAHALEDAYDELELLGFPLCSPFAITPDLPEGSCVAADLAQHEGRIIQMAGYYICAKAVRTVRGERMYFANFVDRDGEYVDVTIFPPQAEKYPLAGPGVYLIAGRVVQEFGVYSLELQALKKYPYAPDPRRQLNGHSHEVS
ncbi:MAG: DNA polymerase III subunit alpha, partial [Bacteroidetes bacterium]